MAPGMYRRFIPNAPPSGAEGPHRFRALARGALVDHVAFCGRVLPCVADVPAGPILCSLLVRKIHPVRQLVRGLVNNAVGFHI